VLVAICRSDPFISTIVFKSSGNVAMSFSSHRPPTTDHELSTND
jgi:hypothetical protein